MSEPFCGDHAGAFSVATLLAADAVERKGPIAIAAEDLEFRREAGVAVQQLEIYLLNWVARGQEMNGLG
jgi:hypothetical protein